MSGSITSRQSVSVLTLDRGTPDPDLYLWHGNHKTSGSAGRDTPWCSYWYAKFENSGRRRRPK